MQVSHDLVLVELKNLISTMCTCSALKNLVGADRCTCSVSLAKDKISVGFLALVIKLELTW
jgi:hypothetical protein